MATTTYTSEKLDIGRVIQMTFTGLRQNFARLLPLIGLLVVLPSAVALTSALLYGGLKDTTYSISPVAYLNIGIGLVTWALFQSAGIRLLISDTQGERPTLQSSLVRALGDILPLFAIVALYALAVWLTAIFLLVPGIIVGVVFSMAVPAWVIERPGVFAAFGRSRNLTRGNRWRIAGLIAIYLLITLVLELTFLGVSYRSSGLSSQSSATRMIWSIAFQVIAIALGLIGLSGSCSLYSELRRMRDGVGSHDLAAIFD